MRIIPFVDFGSGHDFSVRAVTLQLRSFCKGQAATPWPAASRDSALPSLKTSTQEVLSHLIQKQSIHLIKLECPACGHVIRPIRNWIEDGVPTCCCGELFEPTG